MNDRLKHTRPKITRAVAGKSMREVCCKAADALCLTNTVINIMVKTSLVVEELLDNRSLDISAAVGLGFAEGVAFTLQEIAEGKLDMSIIQVDKKR